MGWGSVIKAEPEDDRQFLPRMTNNTARPITILGIDFETYYGQNFSLTKLSTTQYVRNLQKSEIHGAAVSVENGEITWYGPDELAEFLSNFDWERTAVLAHNAAFDGFILSQHFGITPAYYYDSMSMARGLHSHDISASLNEVAKHYLLGAKTPGILAQAKGKLWKDMDDKLKAAMIFYCINDVKIMWKIFNRMLPSYPQDELDLINITIQAFARPLIHIDKDLVYSEWMRERDKKDALMDEVMHLVHYTDRRLFESALSSNPQFAKMLEYLGAEVPLKPSPSNPETMTYAFAKNDIAFQNLQIHADKRVRDLVEARLSVKSTIGESRAERLILHGDPTLPVMLNYCKAHTMRWTGGDKINPQNFPSGRTDSRIREALVPPEGYKLVVIDSSQIEDRMNAWVSGQSDVLEAYRANLDNYKLMASKIYDVPVDEVTKSQRFVGKVARLGLGYQCGAAKFTYMLRSGAMGPPVHESDLSEKDIHLAHKKYRDASSHVVENWNRMSTVIKKMYDNERYNITSLTSGEVIAQVQGQKILMPNGLYLHYPDLKRQVKDMGDWEKEEFSYRTGQHSRGKIYGGLLAENLIQCLARIVVGEQMLEIASHYPIVMMTHDEVVYLAEEDEAEEAYNFGLSCMRKVPDWCEGLPINADGGFGNNYGEIK